MEANKDFKMEFVNQANYRMDESLRMVKKCFDQLSEELIWKKPNSVANSIGNLILHLCGNITQYGIASLQGLDDERNRDEEFETVSGYTKSELLQKLEQTVELAKTSFNKVSTEELLKPRKVQGFEFSGIGNVVHVVEHFSYHTGQIALWTKLLNNQDLGFYDGFDLNIKNEK
ncbi:DinB family protein [Flagellimonas sp.]|uniref:DinB family protein n=1 Tax=Flagellimonas sp. TaxID=2058762 RepID=UPI003F4A7845